MKKKKEKRRKCLDSEKQNSKTPNLRHISNIFNCQKKKKTQLLSKLFVTILGEKDILVIGVLEAMKTLIVIKKINKEKKSASIQSSSTKS